MCGPVKHQHEVKNSSIGWRKATSNSSHLFSKLLPKHLIRKSNKEFSRIRHFFYFTKKKKCKFSFFRCTNAVVKSSIKFYFFTNKIRISHRQFFSSIEKSSEIFLLKSHEAGFFFRLDEIISYAFHIYRGESSATAQYGNT